MNKRRTTLGPSSAQGNSRVSLGPSRISGHDSKQPRMSMGAPVARRTSMGVTRKPSIEPGRGSSITSGKGSRMVHDPRNIGDKSFINTSIRALIEFLTVHGFDHPISPKILTKPTNKDFNNIVLFLFSQIDQNYKCTGKIEDEIVSVFKHIGYPFQIAKSNISAVGSPHAWPTLLACLMWVIELLHYDEAAEAGKLADVDNEVDLDDPSSSEKAFYRYLGKAYQLFLSGKDDQYIALEEQFIASFENKNVLIRDQIESLEKKNILLANEIEEVKNRSAYLPELEGKRKDLNRDYLKFQSLIDELQKHRDHAYSKMENRTNELEKLHTSNSAISKEIASLKDRIANQEISPEDVSNMVTERERLEEAQQQASEHRQTLQRRIWELEMALRDKVQALEDCVRAYHGIAEDLKLVPQSARNSRGENLSIDVDIRAKKREGLLKTDVRKHILPIMQDLRQELTQTTLTLRDELLGEQDVGEELELKMNQLREQAESSEARIKRCEAAYKREKEQIDQTSEMHRTELEALESRLSQLKDITTEESRIQQANRRIAEINSLRMNSASLHAERKAELINAIMDIVSQCAVHREHVQSTLKDVKEEYTSRLESLLADQQILSEAAASTATVLSSNKTKMIRCSAGPRSGSPVAAVAAADKSSVAGTKNNTPSNNKSPMSLRSSARKSAAASAADTPLQQQESAVPSSSSSSSSSSAKSRSMSANENENENENTQNDSSSNGLTFPRRQLLSKFNHDEQQQPLSEMGSRTNTGSGKKTSTRAAVASEADYSTSHYYSPNVSQYA